jgi:ABC-type uncharacterized transport system involved in gliding motility auxiliary subunit
MSKKPTLQKKTLVKHWAPVGLWLTGAAVLAIVILLSLRLTIFIGLFSPTDDKWINITLWVCLGIAAIGLAIYALLDPQHVREFFTGREARRGSNALISFLAFFLILIVINVIVYQNPIQGDWTEEKQNTLANETIDTIQTLPAPVKAIGFYTTRSSKVSTEGLFSKVKAKSNDKFDYEFVDPETNPAKAELYRITQDASVVLILQGRQEILTNPTEQEFTNALIRLMNPGERTVYFLTGHGERDIENVSDKSYTRVRTILESKNYTVKPLNLLAENVIPEDALAIIIAGPIQPITDQEMGLVKNYLDKGNALVFLADTMFQTNGENTTDPLVAYLTNSWGITINDDLVIDPSSSQVIVAIESKYGSHSITEKLQSQNLVSFFPTARSISLNEIAEDIQTISLVSTIERSWGETDFTALQNNQAEFDPTTDIAGPLTIAATAQNFTTKGRVVIMGDSDFASDIYFDQYGNGDLFINSIDWAAGQDAMINLTTNEPIDRQMRLLNNLTIPMLAFVFVLLIPGLIIAAGVISWLARRSRG